MPDPKNRKQKSIQVSRYELLGPLPITQKRHRLERYWMATVDDTKNSVSLSITLKEE